MRDAGGKSRHNPRGKLFWIFWDLPLAWLCVSIANRYNRNMESTKVCFECKKEQPIEAFTIRRRTYPMVFQRCHDCAGEVKRPGMTPLSVIVGAHGTRARKYGCVSTFNADEWRTILQASKGKCHWCKAEVGTDKLTIEHLVPLGNGGPNSKENVVAACIACNISGKGERVVKVQFNARLSQDTIGLLNDLATHFGGLSQADIVTMAVRALAAKEGINIPEKKSKKKDKPPVDNV
jgi:hypothetical protein